MKKRGKDAKFCPRCGAKNELKDAYCINCGYSFVKKKKKKTNLLQLLIVFGILVGIWIAIRIFLGKDIFPKEIIDTIKNIINQRLG